MDCAGCPANCLGRTAHPVFCAWWASGDARLRSHVVARSNLAPPAVAATPPTPAEVIPADPGLLRAAETCRFRVIPECGCSGMECAPGGRRAGSLVTIRDCLACVSGFQERAALGDGD